MRFQRIIDAVYHQPLAISLSGFETIDRILRPAIEGKRPEADLFGEDMPQMEIENGVAVIPVIGPLLQHASLLDKQCGATSYDDIQEDLEAAAARGDVRTVIFNFDSPGGQMAGGIELAEFIAEFQRETGIACYAWSGSQCFSAAYMLAVSCDQIFCSRTAMIGSIGCIIGFLDTSEAHKMAGLKPNVFTSGKYKGAGYPGTALTEDQSTNLQSLVDEAFGMFAQHVVAHRPEIEADSMQGQVMFGSVAVALGIADENVDTLEELLDFFQPEARD